MLAEFGSDFGDPNNSEGFSLAAAYEQAHPAPQLSSVGGDSDDAGKIGTVSRRRRENKGKGKARRASPRLLPPPVPKADLASSSTARRHMFDASSDEDPNADGSTFNPSSEDSEEEDDDESSGIDSPIRTQHGCALLSSCLSFCSTDVSLP